MRTLFLSVAFVLLSASLPAAESLARGVPDDVFLFGHWRSEPGKGLADSYLGDVRDELRSSGIVDALIEILRENVRGEERDDFDVEASYWKEILTGVDWWGLLSREVAFAARARPEERLELLFLFDTGEDARDRVLVRLRRILYGLCAVVDEYEMIVSDREGIPTSILYNVRDPGEQICLGGHGRAVVVSTSVPLLRQSLELLDGRGSRPPIVRDAEYRKRRAELLTERSGASSLADPSSGDAVFEILLRPNGVIAEYSSLNVVERFHFFSLQRESEIDWGLRYALRDTEENRLARAFESQQGVGDLLRRVPAGVSAFTVEAGAEPETYYEYVLEVLGDLSGAYLLPDLVDRVLRDRGFDLKDDLLRYLSGRGITVHLPASEGREDGEKGGGGGRVYLLELKPADAPVSTLTVRLESLVARLKEWGLGVERREDAGGGVFFSVDTGALLGWRLELGITGSYLVVGTSASAIERALAASGDGGGKTILEDRDFASLWEEPEGTLDEVAWGSLAGAIDTGAALMRVVGGLASFIPEEGEAGFFRPALTLLPRLQGAVRSLRFLDRRIGHVVRDGATFRGEGRIFLRAER